MSSTTNSSIAGSPQNKSQAKPPSPDCTKKPGSSVGVEGGSNTSDANKSKESNVKKGAGSGTAAGQNASTENTLTVETKDGSLEMDGFRLDFSDYVYQSS
ncbi:hypothetical protein DL98DRAFT_594865 [Cadophora sp. DSE1049]|nr:hypothetical protein DL98DRAFT_594865 [Cadophora sp. DSE1049]